MMFLHRSNKSKISSITMDLDHPILVCILQEKNYVNCKGKKIRDIGDDMTKTSQICDRVEVLEYLKSKCEPTIRKYQI